MALVVTIVVLLILAGITLVYVFGDNGIFKLAQDAKIRTEIAKIREKVDVVVLNWNGDKILDQSLTVDDLKQRLVDADIMASKDKMTEKGKDANGNDIYEIETKEGYIVEIIITPDGKASTGNITKPDDGSEPKVTEIKVTNTASNSISVEVTGRNLEKGKLNYYYKKADGVDTYHELSGKQETADLTATYTGLKQDQIYDIKVVATKGSTSHELEIQARTGELRAGAIRQKGNTTWSRGKATVELETDEKVLTLKYQIDAVDKDGWIDYTGPIGNLDHGQTVYAVLTDGTNYGEETSVEVNDAGDPIITIGSKNKTTNSITVSGITATDNEWGMPNPIIYSYYIKENDASDYGEAKYTGPATEYEFTGLRAGITHNIKITTKDKAENEGEIIVNEITNTITGATDGLKEGVIRATAPVWDKTTYTASTTISTDQTSLQLQWQKNGITEGNWTTVERGTSNVTVSSLEHGDSVYARLTDGKNYGDYASIDIRDTVDPKDATIAISPTTATTEESVTATVTHNDDESGEKITNCKYIYSTESNKYGEDNAVWSGSLAKSFSTNPANISLNASQEGTYYLHVLTVDKAGNRIETIFSSVVVKPLVTRITVSPTTLSLEIGETEGQLTATVEPTTATQTVTWKSSNTAVATVNETGKVTPGITAGEVTITAMAEDGSGESATCIVTVKEATLKVGSTVIYNPSGTYEWQGVYCSSEKTPDSNKILKSSETNFNLSTWKVLRIDEKTNQVELVPSNPTTGTVKLGKAQGYNNGVKLLNDACSSLYGNDSKGIVARSINIKDIEKYMTVDALTGENGVANFSSYNTKYGERVSEAYTGNAMYPVIYAKEKEAIINGSTPKDATLDLSDTPNNFIERSEGTSTTSYIGAITTANSVQPRQTYWSKDNNFMKNAFQEYTKKDNKEVTYYDLIMPNGSTTGYWVASRCAHVKSSLCSFDMRCVSSGGISSHFMYGTKGSNTNTYSRPLFPIVTLSSKIIKWKDGNFSVNLE